MGRSRPPPQDNFSIFQERYAVPHSDVALKIEQERVSRHSETLCACGVDLKGSAGANREDRDVGANRHVKTQHKSRIVSVNN